MRKVIRNSMAAIAAVTLASAAQAHSNADLQSELNVVEIQIEAARTVVDSHSEPAVRQMAQERLAVLQLTRAILQNRIIALEGGAAVEVEVAAIPPDMAEVAAVTGQMALVEDAIAAAEAAVQNAEGVNRAIAMTRLEAEKLAFAELRVAYIRARFGTAVALFDSDAEVYDAADPYVAEPVNSRPVNTRPAASAAAWADRRYPHIDYSHPFFEAAYRRGSWISGWWTISSGRDRDSMVAQNLSAYRPDAGTGVAGLLLQVSCGANRVEVSVTSPGQFLMGVTDRSGRQVFDVAYRTSGGVLSRDEWQSLAGGGAGVEGEAALDLIDEMYGARTLFVEVIDANNSRHRAEFELAGFEQVADAGEEACAEPELTLNRNDFRLIQTLLNVAGFDAGAADGIWGPRSANAMRRFQQSNGVAVTGSPNRETLALLGLLP